jgi:two-component system sensor histidine kinase/response regulator
VAELENQKSTSPSEGTVLIVDDNPLITTVLKSLLQNEHFDVIVASNGEEALAAVDSSGIDVVVCDVMMPKMDGYEFHESLRARSEHAHIPFIFLTALSDDSEVKRGLLTGADVYLTKPFDPRQILPLIKGKVHRSRALKQKTEEQLEAYRKRVVNTLSHEFRTPLVAITTGSELLVDHGAKLDPARARNLLEAIQRGGQRLEKLVGDFMLLQQLDSGSGKKMYESRGRVVGPETLLERVTDKRKADLAALGFSFQVECSCTGVSMYCYEPYIEDALGRLIDNAVKFSRETKEVRVKAWSEKSVIYFEVADRGVGLDPSKVSQAVELFGQINRDKFEQQGSGMGLALVSRYMSIHGGNLECGTRPEGGAIVRLGIPLRGTAISTSR